MTKEFAPVRKAVFPVAGLGTRVLPATKVMPKEMLTVNGKPLIQWVVEEALQAGIEQLILVTGPRKEMIEKHFDNQPELMAALEAKGKDDMIRIVRQSDMPEGRMMFTRQANPKGLGHAIWCARHLIGDEPFAVILPDDIIKNDVGCMKQLVDVFNSSSRSSPSTKINIVALKAVPREETNKYGIVSTGEENGNVTNITGMVEKPEPEDAPSNLSIVGRYILQPEIFEILGRHTIGTGGEIQLTDAMEKLLESQEFLGVNFEGIHIDCGNKKGLLFANLAYAMDDGAIGPKEVDRMIQQLTPTP